MKTALLLFASLVLCIVARAESPDSIPDPRKTNHSSIYDGAHVLKDADKHRIDDAINALEKKTKAQMMVVTVQTFDGMTIEDWCTKLYRRVGIGHKGKNDGVLFAFAIQDRKSRIEVGPGLQDRLTDARTGEIQRDQIRPAFRRGAYGEGILDGVEVAANYIQGGGRPVPRATSRGNTPSVPANRSFPPGNSSPPSSSPSSSTSYSPPSSSGGGIVLLLGVLAVGGVGGLIYMSTRPRRCPQCNTTMTKSEAPDSTLSDAEQVERNLGSRTFQRWGCPQCGYSEIDKNNVTFSDFTQCSQCGNRTARVHKHTISSATYDSEGEEEVTETCEYPPCRHVNRRRRSISRLVRASSSSSSVGSNFGSSSSDSSSSSSSSSGGSYDGGSSSSYGGGTSDGGGSSSSW